MFCPKASNNNLHKRSIKIALNDYSSDFKKLLENNNDKCNHHRHVQILLIEVFKIKNELIPPITSMLKLNTRINTFNLRNFEEIVTDRKRTD